MHTIKLMGEDHPQLGEVAVETWDSVAVGITRGRHPKAYYYVEPNEDAVVAITTGERSLMVVADGHHGFEGSHAAIAAVARTAPELMQLSGEALLGRVMQAAARAVVDATRGLQAPRDLCATAMAAATVGADGGAAAAVGDCVAVRIRSGRSRVLTDANSPFLDSSAGADEPPVNSFQIRPNDLVLVASDGLVDYIGRPWPSRLARLLAGDDTPEVAVRRAITAAGEGGGGDNVAVGTMRVAGPAG